MKMSCMDVGVFGNQATDRICSTMSPNTTLPGSDESRLKPCPSVGAHEVSLVGAEVKQKVAMLFKENTSLVANLSLSHSSVSD